MSPLRPTPGETPGPPPPLFFQPFAGTHQCRPQLSPPSPPPSPNDKTSQMIPPSALEHVLELTFSLRGFGWTLARESTRRDSRVRKSARCSSEPLSTRSSSYLVSTTIHLLTGLALVSGFSMIYKFSLRTFDQLFSSSSLLHIFLCTPSLHTVVFLSPPRSKT
ncbi:hypothetical protein BGW80DRAFT_1380724 [Lactifluus volemus]|nr:hypothetical protein BGW80DRAFT_1380724 [Lactifluus volemus]